MHGHYRGSWWEYINAWTLVVRYFLNDPLVGGSI